MNQDIELQHNVPFDDYLKWDGVNSSSLKEMFWSPAHYKHAKQNPSEETDAMRFGKLFHAALLEPAMFREKMIVMPKFDRRTKVGKEDHALFMMEHGDRMIVPEADSVSIIGMMEALKNHALAGPLLTNGVRETCARWTDAETGLLCKGRFDFISADGEGVDIKTTTCAKPEFFERQIFSDDYQYFLQASHYTSCARVTKLFRDDLFIIIGVEKKPPYGISVKQFDHHSLSIAEARRRRLMRQLKECLEKDVWPCYPPHATMAIPPKWAFEEEE